MREVGASVPRPPVAIQIPRVGCVTAFANLREVRANPARAIRMANRWAVCFTPETLVINMRPGLPCWLGWAALHQRKKPHNAGFWNLVAVAAPGQIDRSPSDVIDLLAELWHSADERIVTSSVFDRDDRVESIVGGRYVTLGHIMDLSAP